MEVSFAWNECIQKMFSCEEQQIQMPLGFEQITLGEIITKLKKYDLNKSIKIGFCHPHSYRGYYEQLAFELVRDTNIGELIRIVKDAIGNTYMGWKGGEFQMGQETKVWLSKEGVNSRIRFTHGLLQNMLDNTLSDEIVKRI